MRTPWPALASGLVVAALGAAGLWRAAVPMDAVASSAAPIVVSGAYVRAPAPPTDSAAAYFTVTNSTGTQDTLESVSSGAGETTVLHSSGMNMVSGGAVIPAHGRLVLSTGKGHVMIEKLFGTVRAGQRVNLELTFARAGIIVVSAPVIALGAPVPATGGTAS